MQHTSSQNLYHACSLNLIATTATYFIARVCSRAATISFSSSGGAATSDCIIEQIRCLELLAIIIICFSFYRVTIITTSYVAMDSDTKALLSTVPIWNCTSVF